MVTAFRDIETHDKEEREIGNGIYSVRGNTVFQHLVESGQTHYCNNNLEALGENYLNENPHWKQHYNATLAVPIRFLAEFYGVLSVDSLNPEDRDLFNDKETKKILGHAADLMAIYFLLLKMKVLNNDK